MDLRKTFEGANEEKLVHNNPILSAVIKSHLQSYDPRSPSQDFERTPIVISTNKQEKKLLRQLNEHCASPNLLNDIEENCDSCTEANESPELIIPKNLCDGFDDISLNESMKEASGPLGSSTASNEAIEENISPNGFIEDKPTILLETNFEYVETDQFDESNEKPHLKLEKISSLDPRSPSIGIDRTPIVLAKSVDIVEDMSDDSLIKVLQNSNAEFHQSMPQETKKEHLIYEDETANINDTPKNSKTTCIGGSRTPLSCMKNKDAGHIRSKSANTLYDPKKGSKIPKRVSHIPRLKSLTKPSNMLTNGSSVSLKNMSKPSSVGGDCENTPPHSHRDRWDKDCSIVL